MAGIHGAINQVRGELVAAEGEKAQRSKMIEQIGNAINQLSAKEKEIKGQRSMIHEKLKEIAAVELPSDMPMEARQKAQENIQNSKNKLKEQLKMMDDALANIRGQIKQMGERKDMIVRSIENIKNAIGARKDMYMQLLGRAKLMEEMQKRQKMVQNKEEGGKPKG